ncbi:MAG: bifunctional [glutamine synthetase] adenylyltransferase/[glutamine synthetase]-adenylyl-L-tyrosine phosphorylase [Xanthobacteraceae bacterium]|nr:MAG: bifunctional [glutamine synthetase] adenylyltransferase/[glutamine synthetase]-adenylyl-L-tyrosine phosphorylase [Xanthobacteraceae bacterium]
MTQSAETHAAGSMLAARLERAPHPFPPDQATGRWATWLEELAPERAAELTGLLRSHPCAAAVLDGIAESSPYLFDLMRADAERLVRLLRCDPDARFDELIDGTVAAVAAATDEAEVMRSLRLMKAEAALLIALCDIGGAWTVMRVTQALTDIADTAVRCAVRHQLAREAARGRLAPPDPARPEAGSGLVVLAMGKMGAGELNYSSDIDLIVFYNLAAPTLAPGIEPQPFFVRVAQGIARLLSQRTGDGYVFRVDLRLRPDPASTPVAISTAAALEYYEREGRTWERAAMIKARPCAGDIEAGQALLSEIAPFVWRKHLDFAALADVHDMKRQMHAYKGHSEIAVEGHNIKLGRGGIREIEFFVQTQQLIAGGRHAPLRVRTTLDALDALVDLTWIDGDTRDEMREAYFFLREAEHRLQMMADEQTHTLPEDHDEVDRYAHFLGFAGRDAFAAVLLGHLNRVQGHYARLFEAVPDKAPTTPDLDYTCGPGDIRLVEYLSSLGFKQPVHAAGTIALWFEGEYRTLRGEAALRVFTTLVPDLVAGLAQGENPDTALNQFDRFLQALQRGARLFTLLQQNRDLVSLITLILGTAPRLSDMLARQPQVMDGLIDPRFFGALPQRAEIQSRLAASLVDAQSYEDFLDRLRLFGQESLFLLGMRILSGTVSAQIAGESFADVADGIVQIVHEKVEEQFALQHGRLRGQETAIVALGKLGSREMTAASDLDLIVIYDYDDEYPDSDGPKSLHGAQYFARLTHRLINAFTTRTNVGVLYEVDMRLRPSGRAGPVATRIDSFAEYQKQEAWTWEHLALARARVVSASPVFRARIEAVIAGILQRPRDAKLLASDVSEMRRAIAAEKGEDDIWDLKTAAGGLIDIEFIAQFLQLAHGARLPQIFDTNTLHVLDKAARLGVLSAADADVLRPATRLYHDVTQILRLCLSERFKPEEAGANLLRVLTHAADEPDFSALEARLRDTQQDVRRIFLRLVG